MISKILISLFLTCLINTLLAQQNYAVDVHMYTVEHGLPDNHVYQCYQDRNGLMWLMTGRSLSYFDGREFKVIVEGNFSLDFRQSKICFEDADGDLWLSKQIQKGKVEYILVNAKTRAIRTPQEKYGTAFPKNVYSVFLGKAGKLWITTTQGALYEFSTTQKQATIYQVPKALISIVQVDTVHNTILLNVPQNDNPSEIAIHLINVKGEQLQILNITSLYSHYLNKNGTWSLYTGKYLIHVKADGTTWKEPIPDYITNSEQPIDLLNSPLAFDSKTGNHWIIHQNQLHVFHRQRGLLYLLDKAHGNKRFNQVFSIFMDRQGIGWVCSIEGLYKIQVTKERFQRLYWEDPNTLEQPNFASSRSIFQDEKSGILFANIGKCLWAYNGNTYQKLFCRESAIVALAQDPQGRIWMGSESIHCYDSQSKTTRTVLEKIAPDSPIAWSFYASEKRLWIGLSNGLAYLDYADEKLHFTTPKLFNPTLKDAIIYAIYPAEGEQLWILSERGLILFDPQKGVLAHYHIGGKGPYQIPAENFRTLYQENTKQWWLASFEGLLYWNRQTNTKRLFGIADGFPNQNIYAVYPDEYGFLWLSSDRGIIQFQKSSGKTRFFSPEDGITHQEFNRVSHYQAADGTIYFGSLNGVTAFHPRDFYQDFSKRPDASLMLTSANLFSKHADGLEDVIPVFNQKNKITLKPRHLNLNLKFALLDFEDPESTQYEYQIKGLGNRWLPCSGATLQLAGLPYGHFELMIRAKANNGLYALQQLSIPIQVLRPFYLQWWFLLGFISLLLLGIVFFFHYRNQWLKQRKTELEAEVAHQIEKIRQDKTIIEAQAAKLMQLDEAKSRFFANVTHELRTPLTLILGPINAVMQGSKLDVQHQNLLGLAKKHGEGLLEMVNDLLDLSKLEAGKLQVQEQPILLYRKIRLLLGAFSGLAEQKRILFQLEYKADPYLLIQLDDRVFSLIVNNLLSNAFKFTETGGKIVFRVLDLSNQLKIEIEDNGRGIHPDDLAHIFDRYFQTQHPETAFEGGTGIGLALARESAKAIDARLEVASTWGAGTIFTLFLPKKEIIGTLSLEDQRSIETWLKKEFSEVGEKSTPEEVWSNADQQHCPIQVLLVEDNRDMLDYLVQLLAPKYQVFPLGNAVDAQKKLVNWTPDLIVSDVMMPGLDGFQFVEWLKSSELHAHIPIIMLSARADVSDKLRALQTGVDDYILKPFVETELLARIHNLLQRQEHRRTYLDLPSGINDKAKSIPKLRTEEKEWIRQLEEMVVAHLSDPNFTVNKLAQNLLMSRSAFYTEVGRLLGLTPNEYISEIRLKQAMNLLKTGSSSLSVKKLASLVGFKDEKYFSRLFRQRYGVSPSQFH